MKVSIVADEDRHTERLRSQLGAWGLQCSYAPDSRPAMATAAGDEPDVVLVALNGSPHSAGALYLAERKRSELAAPVIALLSPEGLDVLDPALAVDDFVVKPWDATEVLLRMKRTLRRVKGVDRGRSIICGDLVIDVDNCEVTVEGRLIALTFREYELLRFLARNRGRVFTRDALLDEVWGDDYLGGDRTVDVHIRRLRSKIEDSTHSFIETVRSIGYRFKRDS